MAERQHPNQYLRHVNDLPPDQDNKKEISWFSVLGFAFLTYNSGTAVYRSRNDPWNAAFVITAYVILLLLFLCLREFEKLAENAPTREKLKVGIWTLATALTVMFSYKVAAIMPLPVAVIVWLMASTTSIGGFWAFFIYKNKD